MVVEYITCEGDILDEIVYKRYGSVEGFMQMVLSYPKNRYLVKKYGPILPADVKIYLPEAKKNMETKFKEVNLW